MVNMAIVQFQSGLFIEVKLSSRTNVTNFQLHIIIIPRHYGWFVGFGSYLIAPIKFCRFSIIKLMNLDGNFKDEIL